MPRNKVIKKRRKHDDHRKIKSKYENDAQAVVACLIVLFWLVFRISLEAIYILNNKN